MVRSDFMPIFMIIFPIFFCIILVMSLGFFITVFSTTIRRNSIRSTFKKSLIMLENMTDPKYPGKGIPLSRLAEANITDIKVLEDYLYDIFYRFEEAYNNLDYNTMSTLSTSKLYNNYYTDISLNLKIGNRRGLRFTNK